MIFPHSNWSWNNLMKNFVQIEHWIGLTQSSCISTISGFGEHRMSSSRSKFPLLLFGILLCSSFAPLPVISSKRHSIRSAGQLVRAFGSCWDKREVTARDGEYLLGIKRLRRLYCNVGIGFHIQVLPNGKITGVHNENRYSKLFSLSLWEYTENTQFNVKKRNRNVVISFRTGLTKFATFLLAIGTIHSCMNS